MLSVEGQRQRSEVGLTVVNDAAFADWTQLVRAGDLLWAASSTTDALARIDPATGNVTRFPGGDGPSALATWNDTSPVCPVRSVRYRAPSTKASLRSTPVT